MGESSAGAFVRVAAAWWEAGDPPPYVQARLTERGQNCFALIPAVRGYK